MSIGEIVVEIVWVDEDRVTGVDSDHVPIIASVHCAGRGNTVVIPRSKQWKIKGADWITYKYGSELDLEQSNRLPIFPLVQDKYSNLLHILEVMGKKYIGKLKERTSRYVEPRELRNLRSELRVARRNSKTHSKECNIDYCTECDALNIKVWYVHMQLRDMEGVRAK